MEYNCLTRETLDNLRQDGFPDDLISKLNDQNKIRYDQRVAEMTFPTEATPKGELRLVLLGQSGAGKSATGNLLLGENKFEESAMSETCTLTLREECTELNGVRVRIIDTPASCNQIQAEREMNININKVFEAFSEGIDGFLIVFSLGNPRFTKEAAEFLLSLQKTYATDSSFYDHCFCILTNGNDPNLHNMLADEHPGSHFGQMIARFKRKVIIVDNACRVDYFRKMLRKRAIGMVAEKVSRCHGACYRNKSMQWEDKSKVVATLPPDERQYASFYEREIWAEMAEKSLREMGEITHAERENIKARVARKTGRLVTGQIHLAIEKILDAKVQRFRTYNQDPDPPAPRRGTRALGLISLSAMAGLLMFAGVKRGWVKPPLAWPL